MATVLQYTSLPIDIFVDDADQVTNVSDGTPYVGAVVSHYTDPDSGYDTLRVSLGNGIIHVNAMPQQCELYAYTHDGVNHYDIDLVSWAEGLDPAQFKLRHYDDKLGDTLLSVADFVFYDEVVDEDGNITTPAVWSKSIPSDMIGEVHFGVEYAGSPIGIHTLYPDHIGSTQETGNRISMSGDVGGGAQFLDMDDDGNPDTMIYSNNDTNDENHNNNNNDLANNNDNNTNNNTDDENSNEDDKLNIEIFDF